MSIIYSIPDQQWQKTGISEYTFVKKAGGIIFNRNLDKVILVLNKQSYNKGENKWGLPKGHLEKEEKLCKCAMREIHEETGLEITILPQHRCIKINNSYYYIIILNTNKEIDLNPLDNEEIIYSRWTDLRKIPELNQNYDTRSVFKESKLQKIKDIIDSQKSKLLINIEV